VRPTAVGAAPKKKRGTWRDRHARTCCTLRHGVAGLWHDSPSVPVGEMNHVVASAVWSSSASAVHAKTCRRRCGRMAADALELGGSNNHADATTRAMRRSTFAAAAVRVT
jgi:hypothetical protein